jgi:histone acetyltransferase MYST1
MSSTRAVEIGERYLVTWRNGQKQPGEIIEKRPMKKALKDRDGESDNGSSEMGSADYEYYIHFPTFDRRMDEWVTIDRIDLKSVVPGEDEQSRIKRLKRKNDESSSESKEAMLSQLEKEHEEITKVKNIQSIVLGKYEIETWYFSPYPEEYCGDEKMYICEFCLKYMRRHLTLLKHSDVCTMKSPPGREIYREEGLSMFEVDGKENKIYCQNLCLLSKLFLDHKTLYYDVDPFLFYVLCETDSAGCHIVGYFSKEKQSAENYNLACILTFPPYQRKGYGKFLISISYELTKREGTTGSPEKPLSDLGKISYRSYWAYVILQVLEKNYDNITVNDIARMTGIRTEDILSTLHSLNLIKYWKGQHFISFSQKIMDSKRLESKKIRLCSPDCLTWQPPEKPAKKGKDA